MPSIGSASLASSKAEGKGVGAGASILLCSGNGMSWGLSVCSGRLEVKELGGICSESVCYHFFKTY